MVAILDRETQGVNGKNTLIRKALHRGWFFRLAGEVVFMQSFSRLTTTSQLRVEGQATSRDFRSPLNMRLC